MHFLDFFWTKSVLCIGLIYSKPIFLEQNVVCCCLYVASNLLKPLQNDPNLVELLVSTHIGKMSFSKCSDFEVSFPL